MANKTQSAIFITLQSIQGKLVAPKGQYNSFGNYAYRSAEDILEALKPILQEHDATLILQDEVVQIGDRYYVEATATLYAMGETVGSKAYAREDDSKKGMDGSQVTGAASSYARKYALNGLFMIDDNKDPDSNEHREQTNQAANKQKSTTKPSGNKSSDGNPETKSKASAGKYIPVSEAKKLRAEIKNIAEATNSPVNTIGDWFIEQLSVEKIEQIPADRLKEAQELIVKTKKVKGIE